MTLTEERKRDAKQREKSAKETLRAVAEAMRNEDGFERLLAIPDDQWEEAVMRSQDEENAA